MSKCKGYIIENVETGEQFYTVDHRIVMWRDEGWVMDTYQLARFYIDKLGELGFRCITRRMEGECS